MNNPTIKFMENWNNKLNCSYFTTIRLYTKEKFNYYTDNLGNKFNVLLQGKKYCKAILIGRYEWTLKEVFAYHFNYLDAGLDIGNFIKLMRGFYRKKKEWKEWDTKVILLIFKKIK